MVLFPQYQGERSDTIAHPIPYQGSKRRLARAILDAADCCLDGRRVRRLYEPFAGSAAITLAAARRGFADRFVLGDSLAPLIGIWRAVLASPGRLADAYQRLWAGGADPDHYDRVRDEFNAGGDPARLLYLLARCVKSAPRWSRAGAFNQSPDRRRLGARPDRMRREIARASSLLCGRVDLVCADFEEILDGAGRRDLAYLDPPWEGTTVGPDKRYHAGLSRERLTGALARMNRRRVAFLLSYDGATGGRRYAPPLPASVAGRRVELFAGRSSHATLHGRSDETIESLYLSPALSRSPARSSSRRRSPAASA